MLRGKPFVTEWHVSKKKENKSIFKKKETTYKQVSKFLALSIHVSKFNKEC